jgi:hypothetical protein
MDLWSNMKLFVTANDDLMFLDSYSVAMVNALVALVSRGLPPAPWEVS